jgi:hypothetical protein
MEQKLLHWAVGNKILPKKSKIIHFIIIKKTIHGTDN